MKLAAVASLLLSVPVVAVSACSSPQHPSSQPGTTPAVHSGAPGSSATTSAPAGGQSLTAQLKAADGREEIRRLLNPREVAAAVDLNKFRVVDSGVHLL